MPARDLALALDTISALTLAELRQAKAWKVVPPGYPTLDALLAAEIGKTRREATRELIKDARERGKMGGRGNKSSGERPSFSGGLDPDYLAAKLKSDYQAIYARWQAGEFRSVHAAAIEAGIVLGTLDGR